MKQAIAMHGWLSDPNTWSFWEENFTKAGWIWKSADRGYWQKNAYEPFWDDLIDQSNEDKKVLFCHSLGIHLISKTVLKKATAIVLLNSFGRFIPSGRKARFVNTGLNGMQNALGTDKEEEMLRSFLEKASEPNVSSDFLTGLGKKKVSLEGRIKLQNDLELLINTQELPDEFPETARVLVINGAEDAIVQIETQRALINSLKKHLNQSPTSWIMQGQGHSMKCPELINRVRTWLKEAK